MNCLRFLKYFKWGIFSTFILWQEIRVFSLVKFYCRKFIAENFASWNFLRVKFRHRKFCPRKFSPRWTSLQEISPAEISQRDLFAALNFGADWYFRRVQFHHLIMWQFEFPLIMILLSIDYLHYLLCFPLDLKDKDFASSWYIQYQSIQLYKMW